MAALVVVLPQLLLAQAESRNRVRLIEHSDGMVSWIYALARTDGGPISDIHGQALSVGRDPWLAFVCLESEMAVVYRFDTDLLGQDGAVRVQYRFDEQPAQARQAWRLVHDPRAAAELAAGISVLGGDSANAMMQMYRQMSAAARLPGEHVAEFLRTATTAKHVTIRVTDPVDLETHTDTFALAGFADVIGRVTERCRP